MKHQQHRQHHQHHLRRCRAGLSLVEILVALSIAALLLTATAAAFDAALHSYKVNYDTTMVNVAARNSLYRMCNSLRSAWNDPDYDTIDVNVDGTECEFVDAAGRDIIYRYDDTNKQLQMNLNGGEQWYVLVENVEPISVGDAVFTSTNAAGFPPGTVGQVEMRFRIEHGDITRAISAAAVPRNVIYAR